MFDYQQLAMFSSWYGRSFLSRPSWLLGSMHLYLPMNTCRSWIMARSHLWHLSKYSWGMRSPCHSQRKSPGQGKGPGWLTAPAEEPAASWAKKQGEQRAVRIRQTQSCSLHGEFYSKALLIMQRANTSAYTNEHHFRQNSRNLHVFWKLSRQRNLLTLEKKKKNSVY